MGPPLAPFFPGRCPFPGRCRFDSTRGKHTAVRRPQTDTALERPTDSLRRRFRRCARLVGVTNAGAARLGRACYVRGCPRFPVNRRGCRSCAGAEPRRALRPLDVPCALAANGPTATRSAASFWDRPTTEKRLQRRCRPSRLCPTLCLPASILAGKLPLPTRPVAQFACIAATPLSPSLPERRPRRSSGQRRALRPDLRPRPLRPSTTLLAATSARPPGPGQTRRIDSRRYSKAVRTASDGPLRHPKTFQGRCVTDRRNNEMGLWRFC
jgi:hypothetical protein